MLFFFPPFNNCLDNTLKNKQENAHLCKQMILGLYCISQPVSVNHKLLWLKCQETSSLNSSYLTEQQNVPERQNSEGSVSQSRWWLNKQGAQAVTKTSPLPPSSQMYV